MPRYRRWHGQDVFLTLTTAGRRSILVQENVRATLRAAIEEARADWPWSSFHEYVKKGEYDNHWCGHTNIPGMRYIWGD